MRPISDAVVFKACASSFVKTLLNPGSERTQERRFKKVFGVSAATCSTLWGLLNAALPSLPNSACPVHLLWTLYFLKHYGIEEANAAFVGCDEKTYRKWCWICIDALSELDLVSQLFLCCACNALHCENCDTTNVFPAFCLQTMFFIL